MRTNMDNYQAPRQRQAHATVSAKEQFARLLEVESRAAAISGADAATARLLTLTSALRTAGTTAGPAPLSTASRAAMRQRLVAVATVSAADRGSEAAAGRLRERYAAATARKMQRRLAALAGSVTVITGFAGVGVAAAHSLPGDPFYGVKRATEGVQLWATHGDAAKGRLHLEFARTRLAEAEKLPASSPHLAPTLAAMNSQTKQGSTELISAYTSSHSTKPLATLVTFTQQQYGDLTTLAQHLPATLHNSEVTALNVLTEVTGTVRSVSGQACLSCIVSNVTNPGGSKLPAPAATSHPSIAPSPHPHRSVAPTPRRGSTSPHSTSTPGTSPTSTPHSLLPTNLLPSNLLPTNLLSPLLGNGNSTTGTHKHKPTAKTSPVPVISSLLKDLGL